jgi:transcriptional regulator with XRE-family HTH domain
VPVKSGLLHFAVMPATLALSFARIFRGRRAELDLTQAVLSSALGISRSHYAAIEAGRANPSVVMVQRICEILGLRVEVVAVPLVLVTGPTTRDAVHARCSAYVQRRLEADGWSVLREVEVSDGRLRGWIDLVAFDPRSGTLLIIEVKTSIDDIGRLDRQIGWYRRVVATVIPSAWRPARTMSWLLVLSTSEADQAIGRHREVFEQAFPLRAPRMREIVAGSTLEVGERGVALIDPRSRRRDWLIATRVDGRRTPLPYQDRAGTARILGV